MMSELANSTSRSCNLTQFLKKVSKQANSASKPFENKKAFLENKANTIKTSLQKRTEKIQLNKQVLEKEKEIKFAQLDLGHQLKAAPALGTGTTRQERADDRVIQRRLKLAKLAEQNEAKKKAASKDSGFKSNKAPAKKAAKTKVNSSKNTPKKIEVQANEEEQQLEGGHLTLNVPLELSQIKITCVLNGAIDETFTCPLAESNNHSISPSDDHCTFIATTISAKPTLPKLIIQDQSLQSYQMTPPPKERTFGYNYNISKYIDLEDEVPHHYNHKKIPDWCNPKPFYHQLYQQFKLPQEELDNMVGKIFPKITFPVPLEEMGLKINPNYRERTSSVNWRQAEVLQEDVGEQSI